MKILFFVFVLLHGLIHLLGFVKAFDLKEVKELTLPVSKQAGICWLAATLLFLAYSLLYYFNSKQAWIAGLAAVILSQVLVILFWKDARFGTVPNVIILAVSVTGMGYYAMYRQFKNRVDHDFAVNNAVSNEILTNADMAHLPAVVQQYLHYTKSAGKPKVVNFRAEFTGGMRSAPEEDYMEIQSVQYNFYGNPSRYFFMSARKMGLPATGLHLYQNQAATFRVKLLNWFKVVDASGEKMNRAETVTLFNDMCFIAPATLIDKRIDWVVINDSTVNAVFTNGNIRVTALLYFNNLGALVNFKSNDRYHTNGKKYESYPWSTPVTNYRLTNGYFLPGRAKLIYHKPGGDFTYGELEYKSVKYNLARF